MIAILTLCVSSTTMVRASLGYYLLNYQPILVKILEPEVFCMCWPYQLVIYTYCLPVGQHFVCHETQVRVTRAPLIAAEQKAYYYLTLVGHHSLFYQTLGGA